MRLSDHRLHKNGYSQILTRGRRIRGSGFTIRCLEAPDGRSRVGYIIKKKSGSAVRRILLRRLFRECFRDRLPDFIKPTWIVFEVQPKPLNIGKKDLREAAITILRTL